jgi:endonuclease/exonuclease/phosphatase family metal-dependent hydrolase
VAHRPFVYTDATLLYRDDRFDLVDKGDFALSSQPEVPFTRGFGNTLPRMVMWVILRDRNSGREFLFANTHFDNTSPFQERAAPVFLTEVQRIAAGRPVVATGDFNARPTRVAYHTLATGIVEGGFRLVDTYDIAPEREIVADDADRRLFVPGERIDHIFVAGGAWTAPRWAVDLTRCCKPSRFPSDHFAVAARVVLK